MRLIDADALVSALNNGRLKEQTGRAVPFNAGVAFALTMVEYASTIDAVPHWIPCEERLPETTGKYLVSVKNGNVYANVFDGFSKKFQCAAVAWMPLPEPYKEETKE